MNPCDHTSRHCECMTLAEAMAEAAEFKGLSWSALNQRLQQIPGHGCRDCRRAKWTSTAEACPEHIEAYRNYINWEWTRRTA